MSRALAWRGRHGGDEAARDAAQGGGFRTASTDAQLFASQLSRMESTLNSLLASVAFPAAEPAPKRAHNGRTHASLGAAIAEISRRQKALDRATSSAGAALESPPSSAFVEPEARQEMHGATALGSLQGDIAALAHKLDDMHREQAARHAEPPPCNLDKLRAEIGTMSEALRDLGSRGSIASLEQAIRGLAEKIEASRTEGIKETVLEPLEQLVGELRRSLAEIDPRTTIKGLDGELKTLGTKLDDLGKAGLDPVAFQNIQLQTQEIRDLLTAAVARPLPLERIEQQVAQLAETIDRQRDSARDLSLQSYGHDGDRDSAFNKIEGRLDVITAKIDEALSEARDRSRYEALSRRIENVHQEITTRETDTRPLEDLVRSLAEKLERAQEPQAEPQMIEALERQIAELAQRLDRSNTGFSSLTALEETIGGLFTELERTREAALEAAESAARNVLNQAVSASANPSDIGQELQRLRALQDEADRRTLSTLTAVHETLEKVVDRLALVEDELSQRPKQRGELLASGPAPIFAPLPQRETLKNPQISAEDLAARRDPGKTSGMPPAAALEDFLIEPGSGFPGRRDEPGDARQDGGAPATRSDFIAAARRAAQAAQAESAAASVQSETRSRLPAKSDNASLIQQTRNFIAQHKRPVVLSLAALFVAIGAYAVIKTMAHAQPAHLSYNADVPAAASAPIPPTAAAAQIASPAQVTAAALDPSPTASSAQSAVDMMPTGSIGRSKDAASPVREITQADLQAAAESGDAKAQFTLATNYAEGKHVRRDLAAAAEWYAKAAAQGLAPAEYRLASLYEKGMGLPRDLSQARAWYQKAADQGNIRAMHNLAVLAADGGESGKADYATAALWFKKAAEFGVRDSQYNLAVLLARGLGVQKNLVSSYTWFAIAAAQGDDDAAKKRDDVGARLNANQLAAAKAIGASFRAKAPNATANNVQPPLGGSWSMAPASVPASAGKPQRPKVSML